MNVIDSNQEHFQTNSSVHSINTKNKHHIHWSALNVWCFLKNVFYADLNFSEVYDLFSQVLGMKWLNLKWL